MTARLLAVIARKGRATTEYAEKQWVSIKLQPTFLPEAHAAALAPSVAATAIPEGRLEYKPSYKPQQTTITRVVTIRIKRFVPSVAEAIAAVDELERSADVCRRGRTLLLCAHGYGRTQSGRREFMA